MFRTLAMRLTAAYVLAASVLVVIVIAVVTLFTLSIVAGGIREATEAVARQAPEEVRLQMTLYGSLAKAAPEIVSRLARPGLRIALFGEDGRGRRLLAHTGPGDLFSSTNFTPPGPQQASPFAARGAHAGASAERESAASHLDVPNASRGDAPPDGLRRDVPPADAPPAGPHIVGRPARPPWAPEMHAFPLGMMAMFSVKPEHVMVPGGHLVIFPDAAPLERTIRAFWLALIPLGLFVVGAAAFVGRAIAGQALRPLVETTESLRRFGEGDFTPRAIVTSNRSEIGELARAYNAAAAQVSAAFEERRAAEQNMRQFIADAGHELRTPLTVVMGFIDVLRRRAAHDSTASLKIYDAMLVESRRMKSLIEKLIVLARLDNAGPRELETVDLGEVARQVVGTLQTLGGAERLYLQVDAGAIVRGYESELHDALRNLVENALKYAPRSPVEIDVRVQGEDAVVEIADSGPGIAADEQSQVFARFYRGRERGDTEGFGLGLAIAQRAVERAGGRIVLDSALGRGSRFSVRIPRALRGNGRAVAV